MTQIWTATPSEGEKIRLTEELFLLMIGVNLLVLVGNTFLLEGDPYSLIVRTKLLVVISYQPLHSQNQNAEDNAQTLPILTRRQDLAVPGVSLPSLLLRWLREGRY